MSVKMAEDVEGFKSAVRKACQVSGVEKLFSQQFEALKTFVSGTDVFLNLPRGFAKSLVCQMAPLIQAELSRDHDGFAANPVILVISPLEPYGRPEKFLTENRYISWLDKRRYGSRSED